MSALGDAPAIWALLATVVLTITTSGCPIPYVAAQCPSGDDPDAHMRHARLAHATIANGGWRSTGVIVRAGDPLSIVATGQVKTGENCSVTTNGQCMAVMEGPDGHLVARIAGGTEFPVGACWFGRAPAEGELELQVTGAQEGELAANVSWGAREAASR